MLLALGGAIVWSAPASAATTPGTDTISVVNNGTTTLTESLPPGTPDVVIPLVIALNTACAPLSSDILATSAAQVCDTAQFGPTAGSVVVVGVGNSAGVVLPTCFGGGLSNSIVIIDGNSGVVLAPPNSPC